VCGALRAHDSFSLLGALSWNDSFALSGALEGRDSLALGGPLWLDVLVCIAWCSQDR
jgi:hypothetical protein